MLMGIAVRKTVPYEKVKGPARWRIQNPAEHLRWSFLKKQLMPYNINIHNKYLNLKIFVDGTL